MEIGTKQAERVYLGAAWDAERTRRIARLTTPTVRVGLVGLGRWGKNLLRVLQSTVGVRLIGAAEPHSSSVPPDVQRRGLDELLEDPSVDAVVLATPSALHYQHARQALAHQKHVFVEKPLAHSVRDAFQLCALAAAQRRCLMVGHILRYHPAIAVLRDLLQSGELGRPTALAAERIVTKRSDDPWWCLAPHDFSVAEYVLDAPITRVRCTGTGDRVLGGFTNSLGVAGSVEVGVGSRKHSRLVVECSRGRVVFTDVLEVDLGRRRFTVPFDSSVEPLAAEMQHFAGCIRAGAEPLSGGKEGLRVVRALAAGDRSRRVAGRWQDVEC